MKINKHASEIMALQTPADEYCGTVPYGTHVARDDAARIAAQADARIAELEKTVQDQKGWMWQYNNNSDRIGKALEPIRQKRHTGEPARCDADEVQSLVWEVKEARRRIAELEAAERERDIAANLLATERRAHEKRIAELEAENAKLRADAARYLWLRDVAMMGGANVNLGDDYEGKPYVEFVPSVRIPEPADLKYEDEEWSILDLDAAIDAAIAKGKAK